MTKFKGRHSFKQYINNNSIKRGFTVWCRCKSTEGYLYKFDEYLDKKDNVSLD